MGSLDRLYGMAAVSGSTLFQFPDKPAVDLRAVVLGPDDAPFVLDAETETVYRIDLKDEKASAIFRKGNKAAGATQAFKLLAVGGRDLLMVDAKNVVWRWQPANSSNEARSPGFVSAGRRSGARTSSPSARSSGTAEPLQLLRRRPVRGADPPLHAGIRRRWLRRRPASGCRRPDVSTISSVYIDGDIWLADGGQLLRVS